MKGPGNESSQERKVFGTNVLHRNYLFLGTKSLGYKKSVIPGKNVTRL